MRSRIFDPSILTVAAASVVTLQALGCREETVAPLEPARISVTVIVAGTYPSDPFQVEVDGQVMTVPLVGRSLLIKGLAEGTHTVSLVHLPSDCQSSGATTAKVETSAALVSPVEFRVSCYSTGAVAVSLTISGADETPSFAVFLDEDDVPTFVTGSGTTVLATSASAGVHRVHLLSRSSNCPQAGELSMKVNVRTGGLAMDTAVANFNISCAPVEPGVSGAISGTLVDSATLGRLIDVAHTVIRATRENSGQSVTWETAFEHASSFALAPLTVGRWDLSISVVHGWLWIFPGMPLYRDTTITVDVAAGETTVIPPVVLRPRPLILLVGVNTCPWPLRDPPTLDDWGDCDSGYWGGAQVEIDVAGVEGTATAAEHFHGTIGSGSYVWPPPSWDNTAWSLYFNITVPGDYDVKLVDVRSPSPDRPVAWHLVPWESSTTRVTVTNVLGYVGLDFFWHQ